MKFRLIEETIDRNKGTKLFRDCIQKLKSRYPNYDYDNIKLQFDKDKSALGKASIVDGEGPKFKLFLCEYHLVDSDEQIINTIYHEMAHILDMQDKVNSNTLFLLDNGKWGYNKDTKVESHGESWHKWAKALSSLAGSEITETGDSAGIDVYSDSNVKYAVECADCGNVVEVPRITGFVQNCINVEKGSGKYSWACGKCGKKNWKVIKASATVNTSTKNTEDIEDLENEQRGKIKKDTNVQEDFDTLLNELMVEGLTVE